MPVASARPSAPLRTTPRSTVGPLLRSWRTRRRRSQLDLAIDVGVSTRHLSFVETGRARPSPELVLALAHHLDVPLRERNALLLAAGYAPRFTDRSLDDPSMHQARAALQRLLEAHDPFPGVVVDRQWNVVLANAAAIGLVRDTPPPIAGPPLNIYRVSLHPDGLARRTLNFAVWARHLVEQLRRSVARTGDPALAALLDEVTSYPNVVHALASTSPSDLEEPALLVPLQVITPLGELRLFTTITTFGTPAEITLDELAVELFFPADEATAALLRGPDPRPAK